MNNRGTKKIKLELIKSFCQRHRHLLTMAVITILFFLTFLYIRSAQIYYSAASHQFVGFYTENQRYEFNEVGQQIVNDMILDDDTLNGVRVKFNTVTAENQGTMSVYIEDLDTNTMLYSDLVEIDYLNHNADWDAMFDRESTGLRNHTIRVTLKLLEVNEESDLAILIKQKTEESSEVEFIDGLFTDSNRFATKYFAFLWTILAAFVLVVYLLVFVKKAKIETIFLVSALILGILYTFLVTPYAKPDEEIHIDNTYSFSNRLLGISDIDDEQLYKRETDVQNANKFEKYPSVTTFRYIWQGLFEKADNTELIAVEGYIPTVQPFIYAPGILGVTIARVLNLNTIWLVMLGSWFNLLAYSLLVYFGMKKLPFGKILLFIIATLPMSIQQASSFSYDAMVNGITIFFVCYAFYLIYEKEHIETRDVIGMAVLTLGLSWGKGGAYMPLLFLLLLIPKRRFTRDRNFYLFLAGIFAIMCIGYFSVSLSSFIATNGEHGEKIVKWANLPGHTLKDVIMDPKTTIILLVNTFFHQAGYYLTTFIGGSMGKLDIYIFDIIIYLYMFLILLAPIKTEKERQMVTVPHKIVMGIISLACIGLILLSMLLDWTPKGFEYITGVQGRYFIPVAFTILMPIRSKLLTFKKSPECFFIASFMIIQVMFVYSLIYKVM